MTVWSTQSKNSASFNTESKSLGGLGYLLMEDGSYLLQENGDKIVLEQSSAGGIVWDTQTKS